MSVVSSSSSNFCRAITYKLIFSTRNIGDVHVVGGGRKIFELAAVENIESDKMDLSMTVFAGLRGGHVNDLARAALDHDVSVLAQSRALHGEGGRRAGIGGLEGHFMLLHPDEESAIILELV